MPNPFDRKYMLGADISYELDFILKHLLEAVTTVDDLREKVDALVTDSTARKVIALRDSTGSFPSAGSYVEVKLPNNAVITDIFIYSPLGAVTETSSASFTLETAEATPTLLASVETDNHAGGFEIRQDAMFVCDTEAKRTIRLKAGSDVAQPNPKALCIVEYIK